MIGHYYFILLLFQIVYYDPLQCLLLSLCTKIQTSSCSISIQRFQTCLHDQLLKVTWHRQVYMPKVRFQAFLLPLQLTDSVFQDGMSA